MHGHCKPLHGSLPGYTWLPLFFIILRISLGAEEDELEDEDEFVIGYTHKGGGITVVLMVEGFLER